MSRITKQTSLLIIGVVLALASCIEQKEGCLDPDAKNLDISADIEGECTYPLWRLAVSHQWIDGTDTSALVLGESYSLTEGTTIRVDALAYYIHDVTAGPGGDSVMDVVTLMSGEDIKDDLVILSPTSPTNEIGDRRFSGGRSELTFTIGYDERFAAVDTALLAEEEENHPWFDGRLNTDAGRYWLAADVAVIREDTILRQVRWANPSGMPITLEGAMDFEQAIDATVTLRANYFRWFDGVDWASATDEDLSSHVTQQLPNTWQLVN